MENIKPSLINLCTQAIGWVKLSLTSFTGINLDREFSVYEEEFNEKLWKETCDLRLDLIQEQQDHQQSVTTLQKKLNLLQSSHDAKVVELYQSKHQLHLADREKKILIAENAKLCDEVTSFSLKEIRTLGELKSKWLRVVIEEIDQESAASCGSYYEIYEDRKQRALSDFLSIHANLLSDEELKC